MTALNTMVKKVAGLADTKDVTPWQNRFIKNVVRQTSNGDNTTSLTEAQIDTLEELYERHFA
ncbi:hypothetical protein [Variovorax sp. JS1663]|uniref:hypothetical protein n=1 Tax=Variovorax sp. JS1663 TaxID=1851577 RepID=UPI000B3438C2|nr:hypothetical protein [Variovorax sp. JS1663]OUM01645.1 hypothetical protein A8M77_15340 [Variovorax sp. JS1663]